MGEAIGQVLPLAVGVALSPVPIIAAVLMLVLRAAVPASACPRRGGGGLCPVIGAKLVGDGISGLSG